MNETTAPNIVQALFQPHEVQAAFADFVKVVAELARTIAEWVGRSARLILESIQKAVVPGKWWHLAHYARKARTRKKYKAMIAELFLTILQGVTT